MRLPRGFVVAPRWPLRFNPVGLAVAVRFNAARLVAGTFCLFHGTGTDIRVGAIALIFVRRAFHTGAGCGQSLPVRLLGLRQRVPGIAKYRIPASAAIGLTGTCSA